MKWYQIKAGYYRRKNRLKKDWKKGKQYVRELPKKLDQRVTTFVESTGYQRRHCWSGMEDVDFLAYKQAVESSNWFCYYSPVGWLPWSGIVIGWKYKKLMRNR